MRRRFFVLYMEDFNLKKERKKRKKRETEDFNSRDIRFASFRRKYVLSMSNFRITPFTTPLFTTILCDKL